MLDRVVAAMTNRSFILLVSVGILSLISMVFVMVWCNIDRADTGYDIQKLEAKVAGAEAHKGKLEVERERLLSPYELGIKAKKRNMHQPSPGQVRRVREN